MVTAGFALQVASFFTWLRLLETLRVRFSATRAWPNAPLFFILSVMLILLATLVYELQPDEENR